MDIPKIDNIALRILCDTEEKRQNIQASYQRVVDAFLNMRKASSYQFLPIVSLFAKAYGAVVENCKNPTKVATGLIPHLGKTYHIEEHQQFSYAIEQGYPIDSLDISNLIYQTFRDDSTWVSFQGLQSFCIMVEIASKLL